MRLKGKDIERLIPQRYPFVMVDEFEQCGDQQAATALTVRGNNYFVISDGSMAETGVIEHIAQSCSALAGAKATDGKTPVGMIAEIKHFSISRRPKAGERLETTVTFGLSFGPMTLAHGSTAIGGEPIAEADLKIFIQ